VVQLLALVTLTAATLASGPASPAAKAGPCRVLATVEGVPTVTAMLKRTEISTRNAKSKPSIERIHHGNALKK